MTHSVDPHDPHHRRARGALRLVGPAVFGVGLIFVVIGFGSFFSSFGSFEPPRYFWCAFVGLPLIAIGLALSKFAFLGTFSRYVANEVAPVGKDVVNYMADGTKDAVRDVAAALGDGFRTGVAARGSPTVHCQKCGANNEASASFCKGCGTPLAQSRTCAGCGERNDPDARFCDRCGKAIASFGSEEKN